MKNIVKILIFYCSHFYSQTNPVNTDYYKNGGIKHIFFKNDWIHPANTVDVYYDSLCAKKDKSHRIIDSAKGWIKESRFFLRDSTIILKHFGKTFNDLYGISFDIAIYEPNHISIYLNITKDSLIDRIGVQRCKDDIDFPLRMGKTLLWTEYSKPTEIKELNPVLLDNDLGDLIVSFYSKYFIKRIIYRRKNFKNKNEFLNTEYLFYNNNKIKQHGTYLFGFGRIGKWYTYYENGKLSSEGEYSGSEFGSNGIEFNIKKTGKWFYYSEKGCINKEEKWNNGVLVNEETQKRQKKIKK